MSEPDRRRRSAVLAAILVGLALLVVGCAQTVNGHGTAANNRTGTSTGGNGTDSTGTNSSSGSSSSGQPSTSGSSSSAPSNLTCPTVVDGGAGLTYGCLSNSMTHVPDAAHVWPTDFQVSTETNWGMNQGSGHFGSLQGKSPSAVALVIAQAMVKGNTYGDAPALRAMGTYARVTVDAKKAYVQQFTVTINSAYRKTQKLKVTQERLWIVLVKRASNDYSAMFFSIPNTVQKYWASVPKLIAATKVS